MNPQALPKLEVEVPVAVRLHERGQLRLRFAGPVKYARVVFRFDHQHMLLTGPGKELETEECEFLFRSLPEDAGEIDLEIRIPGKLESSIDLPVEIFMSDNPRRKPAFMKSVVIKLDLPAASTVDRLQQRSGKVFNALAVGGPKLLALVSSLLIVLGFFSQLGDVKDRILTPPMEGHWEFRPNINQPLGKDWVGAERFQLKHVGKTKYDIQDVLVVNSTQAGGINFDHPFYDGAIYLRLWNPVGSSWTLRAQEDGLLGYAFSLVKSPAGKLVLKERTVYRSGLSRRIVKEDYDKEIEMPFSDCCDERDVLDIAITLEGFNIHHEIRRERFELNPPKGADGEKNRKIGECPAAGGLCKGSGDFTDRSGRFRFGNLGLFVENVNKPVWVESIFVYPKVFPTLTRTLVAYLKDIKDAVFK